MTVIVLDELTRAKKILESGLSKFMSGKEIRILINYFRYIGVEEESLYGEVIKFLNEKQKDFVEAIHQEFIYKLIKNSKKYPLKIPVDVSITQNEINRIKTIKNYRLEKLLFTCLVLAKYQHLTNINKDNTLEKNDYYNLYIKKTMILVFAKISKKPGENLFYDLKNLGFIKSNPRSLDGSVILFFNKDDSSDSVVLVNDINNIWSFYPPYCEICGNEIKKTGKNHKMCDECWIQHRLEYKRNYEKNRYHKKSGLF